MVAVLKKKKKKSNVSLHTDNAQEAKESSLLTMVMIVSTVRSKM